jgi:hypothetical protein
LVYESGQDEPHLSNVSKDEGEKNNTAKQHPEVVKELQKAYDQWWKSTNF